MHITYTCEHCSEDFKTEHECVVHEERCPFNPVFRFCFSCHDDIDHSINHCVLAKKTSEFSDGFSCEYWKDRRLYPTTFIISGD